MMETDEYRRFIATDIRKRIVDLRQDHTLTSKGEVMSLAAIGRTLDPPVTRTSVYLVVAGKSESARIKEAVERELDRAYWIRKKQRDDKGTRISADGRG